MPYPEQKMLNLHSDIWAIALGTLHAYYYLNSFIYMFIKSLSGLHFVLGRSNQYSGWIVNHPRDDWPYTTKPSVCVELVNFYINQCKRVLRKKIIIVFLTLQLVGINIFVVTVGYWRKFGIILFSPKSIG